MRLFFFFFFLNLYKATFLCLSLVYMVVYAVYGSVRLCEAEGRADRKRGQTSSSEQTYHPSRVASGR
jgi:hypothetical protein